jgi:hypothetical protein
MTRTSNVSDSFLNPVINKGELSMVREVEIKGDEYVRIAGREEVANVALEALRRVRDTMKLPIIRKALRSQTNFQIISGAR